MLSAMSAAPSETEIRRRRWPRVLAWVIPVALVLGAAGYVAVVATAPMPAPTVHPGAELAAVSADPAAAQAAVDEQSLPTAIAWLDGKDIWTNDDAAHPLASISKLVTVLVCQEVQPIAPGEDGPGYTWTEADAERQDYYLSLDGVAFPVPVGTEMTARQMLTLIFLPSANDFAAAYAYSVFGDNETFVAAVRDWADRHELASLELVEPTGMDEGNVASTSDIIRIGRMVLSDPALAEFTRTRTAVMPWGIGVVENTNPLLGELPGMLGVKTGRSASAGFNYLAAQKSSADGRDLVKMSVTLGRPSIEARAQSGREMLAAVEELPQLTEVITEGERVGTLVGADGASVDLLAKASAETTLLPGESAERSVEFAASPSARAREFGAVTAHTPSGDIVVPIRRAAALPEPDLWWRLTHPTALFR